MAIKDYQSQLLMLCKQGCLYLKGISKMKLMSQDFENKYPQVIVIPVT